MREQIIKCINEGLETIKENSRNSLLILESERVQSSRIRELLQSSDIKFIDCLSYNMKDVGNFIHKFDPRFADPLKRAVKNEPVSVAV